MIAASPNPLQTAQQITRLCGGGVFIGINSSTDGWVVAPRQEAVLVVGPPRSGKTSHLIIPAILSALGPVVSTSTKIDVLEVTANTRSKLGRVWLFDPLGKEDVPVGVLQLRWSPVRRADTWDGARAMADAMVGASGTGNGTQDSTYWSGSAKMLLAPLLHAAALSGRSIADVRQWIMAGNLDVAGNVLHEHKAVIAVQDLTSISETEERGLSGILASTRLVLEAYGSEAVLNQSVNLNFDPQEFAASNDTIYITSPSHAQEMSAPLISGLLEDIRDAVYLQHRQPDRQAPHAAMLWALDEVANISPLQRLPGIVSEAGGQGLQVMACLQDLSQARVRWGAAADGFMSLFTVKVIFSGIGDRATLDALSTMAGDWDRPYVTRSRSESTSFSFGQSDTFSRGNSHEDGTSRSYQREAQISASEVSNIPEGHALHLHAGNWGLLRTTPYFRSPAWGAVLTEASQGTEKNDLND